ncbi:MscS Mechanosensitive ion channel [Anaeromyxobacter sp. K]|nr:MscS Mechanosensitive ion channel [Anaeromyxobacter sp. K]
MLCCRAVNVSRTVTVVLLVLLLGAVGAGLFLTRDRGAPDAGAAGPTPAGAAGAPSAGGGAPGQGSVRGGGPGNAPAGAPGQGPGGQRPRRTRLVDMRPLLTAKQLSAYATTPEEQELSRQAERLADHAIDLAFAVAMRDAAESVPEQTPELKALAEARARAQAAVDAAEGRVAALEARVKAAPERERVELEDQLEVARAELELENNELASATDQLQRAGGDPQVRIRRLREVYDAAQKEPRPPVAAVPATAPSLLARWRVWGWHRAKAAQLAAAQADIQDRAQRLAKRRDDLVARKKREAEEREAAKASAARVAAGEAAAADRAAKAEAVKALQRFSDDQRRLATIGRRLQDLNELSDTYGQWREVVHGHVRAALHRLLWGLLGLLAVVAAGFGLGEAVDRFFRKRAKERLRVETVRTVARLGVNVVTVLVALFVLFGAPGQATTVLGLAGAGLTVALKDFIVAFFGWFILMGRNGIRVGDWVEIKGVGGEVVEIGLFHTVLLETGSWNDAGHPTGRRVSFVNSFAIEGHYFNFSTSGQWMWDELRLLVPLGRDPYPVIDGVQHLVEKETEANAKAAETEWRKTTSRYAVQSFSAVPGIQVVPAANGMEVVVRYITRASQRHDARQRLYRAVLELMHGPRAAGPASPPGAAGPGASR